MKIIKVCIKNYSLEVTDAEVRVPFASLISREETKLQHYLSRIVWSASAKALLSRGDLDLRARARLRATSLPHAGAFLRAAPIPWLQLRVSSPLVFRVMLWRFLGIPLVRSSVSLSCQTCSCPMGVFGDHGIVCRRGGGANQRHRHVQDLLFHAFRDSGLKVSREPRHLLPGSNLNPGDLLVRGFSDSYQHTAFDVSITDSLQSRTFPMQQSTLAIEAVCLRKRSSRNMRFLVRL